MVAILDFQNGHPCVPKIPKLVVSYRIRFMAFQSLNFFPPFSDFLEAIFNMATHVFQKSIKKKILAYLYEQNSKIYVDSSFKICCTIQLT